MNYSDKMLKYILKKWYIVLLCALIGAGVLYIEKAKVAPSVAVNGNLLYTRVVKVEPVPYVTYGGTSKEIDLLGISSSWRAANTFANDLENNLDMEKLCIGWKNLNKTDRMNWIGRHVRIINVGPGLYEMEMQFAETDGKDTTYIEENSAKLMDSFLETFIKTASPLMGDSKMMVIDNFNLSDTRQEVTQAGLQKKYIIVGLVLGALAGAAILALLSLRVKEAN